MRGGGAVGRGEWGEVKNIAMAIAQHKNEGSLRISVKLQVDSFAIGGIILLTLSD